MSFGSFVVFMNFLLLSLDLLDVLIRELSSDIINEKHGEQDKHLFSENLT